MQGKMHVLCCVKLVKHENNIQNFVTLSDQMHTEERKERISLSLCCIMSVQPSTQRWCNTHAIRILVSHRKPSLIILAINISFGFYNTFIE